MRFVSVLLLVSNPAPRKSLAATPCSFVRALNSFGLALLTSPSPPAFLYVQGKYQYPPQLEQTQSALVSPLMVCVSEDRRIENQTADENDEKNDSSAERIDKHGEPIKRSQAAKGSCYREAPPRPEYIANIATNLKEGSVKITVGSLGRVLAARISTKPINLLYTKFLQLPVNFLFDFIISS